MIGVESRYLAEEYDRQHIGVAVVASVASVVFHLVLFLILVRMDFSVAPWSRVSQHPKQRPFELVEVKHEALPDSKPLMNPGEPLQPANLPKQADVMGVPPDEVVVQPPVLPEDKLASELRMMAQPNATPKRAQWEPRQEILTVEKRVATERTGSLSRRKIPRI